LVDGAWLCFPGTCRRYRRRDVVDVDRLQLCASGADQRQDRPKGRHRGEAVEELVLWAEDKAGSQDNGVWKLIEHRLLALRLGPRKCSRCWMVGWHSGDVYQPGPGLACGFGHRPCAYHMDAC